MRPHYIYCSAVCFVFSHLSLPLYFNKFLPNNQIFKFPKLTPKHSLPWVSGFF